MGKLYITKIKNKYLGEVFAGRRIDRGIHRMRERTSRTSLTSALAEKFTRDMFRIYSERIRNGNSQIDEDFEHLLLAEELDCGGCF